MNRQLSRKDIVKVVAAACACVVVFGGAFFALQSRQAENAHTESLKIQALEMGRTPDDGSHGPIEEEGQQSDPHFQP